MSSLSETTTPVRPSARNRFEPGTVVSGRYRILGPLRAGRLDEAYRAEDTGQGAPVALKVLRRATGTITPPRSLVRLLKRLTKLKHENVARVHDLAVHVERSDDNEVSSALFVVSDLVEGEPLGSFVRNERPLDRELALTLIDGICSGLAAIHRKRIVHGDLNSSAVTLVRDGDSLRPVITDFSFETPEARREGASIGSSVYRAPETIVGRVSEAPSDVFSLGVLIYEILSGRMPFTGGHLLALDFRSLGEEPRGLRELVDDLDPVLERVVARCLSRAPEDRYASAREVRRAIRGEEFWTPRARRNVGTLSAAAALVIAMVGGSALLDRVSEMERRREPIVATAYRPSFAILDLAPLGQETEPWIAIALSELIRADFSRDAGLRVAEPDLVREYAGLARPLSGAPNPDLATTIRTLFDVEAIVIGTCSISEGIDVSTVGLDLCVIDARTGETIAAAFERGSPETLPELASRASTRIRGALGLRENDDPSARWDPDAVRPWAEGLLSLRNTRVLPAVEALEAAAQVQPGNARIHDALTIAWSEVGSSRRAAEAARRAIDLSRDDSSERAMERRATLALLEGDVVRAIDERGRLARAFPDRTVHVYRLIDTLLAAGATRPAAEEIRRLRAARATVDPRTEIADAQLNGQVGRFEDAAMHAERAAAIAATSGSARLRGEALLELAWSEAALGRSDDSLTTLAEAERIFEQGLDSSGRFRAATLRAGILQRRGELDAALAIHEALGDAFRDSGREQNFATTLGSRATILSLEGRHEDALMLLDDATARFVALGDEPNIVRSLGIAGGELLALGRLDGAYRRFEEAAAIAARAGLRAWEGFAHAGLARVEIERLELERAEREIDRAAAIFGSVALGSSSAGLDIVRSEVDRLRGRLAEAEARLTGSVAGEREVLDRERQAALHVALATIALSSGRAETAGILADRAAAHWQGTGNVDRELECLTIALEAAGRTGDAAAREAALRRLTVLEPRTESPLRSLRLRLAQAGGMDENRARVERVAVFDESGRQGLRLIQIEAAAALRSAARSEAERARWDRELTALARASGAGLFLPGRN